MYFFRSPVVFSSGQLQQLSDDERVRALHDEFTTHTGLSGSFMNGADAARKPEATVNVESLRNSEWDLGGWWSLYGGSTPERREIGKALAGMSPSSCDVERSFFLHTNLNLMGEVD